MRLLETDADALWPEVLTVVLEETAGDATNAYGYVTATYNAKKRSFALAGKLWDGTAVKGTETALADGCVSPVLVTDNAKNAVTITLGSAGGDLCVFVRENGELVPVGRKAPNGYEPLSASFAAADLKSKKFNVTHDTKAKPETGMTTAETLVVLTEGGEELALPIPEKSLTAAVSAQGLVKFTVTDEDGWKWVCELLPVDNGGARQFRGIATGTKKNEPTQVCPVWAE